MLTGYLPYPLPPTIIRLVAAKCLSILAAPPVSAALVLPAPVRVLSPGAGLGVLVPLESSLGLASSWSLVPLHASGGGATCSAALCEASWRDAEDGELRSMGNRLRVHAPLRICNDLAETVQVSFAVPGDLSERDFGFSARLAPGQRECASRTSCCPQPPAPFSPSPPSHAISHPPTRRNPCSRLRPRRCVHSGDSGRPGRPSRRPSAPLPVRLEQQRPPQRLPPSL